MRRRLARVCPWLRLAAPAGWALLLAIHLPLLVAALAGLADGDPATGSAGGVASLALTSLLFALKLADVPFLRLPTPAAALAFVLVAAIAHHEVVAPATDAEVDWRVPVALVTAVGLHRAVRRGGLLDLVRRLTALLGAARPIVLPRWRGRLAAARVPVGPLVAARPCIPRSPPVRTR